MRSAAAALYQHTGVALLRSTVAMLTTAPSDWPDPANTDACRDWLDQVWTASDIVDAIEQASPALAEQVASIRSGSTTRAKDIRRAVLSTARYLLRATGRPTPFGLFAGVARVELGSTAQVRWGREHHPVVRADTSWLASVIDHLETVPELLERLDVVITNLAVRRGRWLEAPHGPDRVRLVYTPALDAVRQAAVEPIRFSVLADKLAVDFDTGPAAARGLLASLVSHGVLVTGLRAPFTVTDPLAYLLDRLHDAKADNLSEAAGTLTELEAVRARICSHNLDGSHDARVRVGIANAMRRISTPGGRSPLAIDLHLDCQVQVPAEVITELERATAVLLRLAREPSGSPGWIAYHRAFIDRYGTGTLMPVTDIIDPDTGLGYPPTYPGSLLPDPAPAPSDRDQALLALAWQAAVDGNGEITLTDELVERLASAASASAPPHVEVAARIHAPTRQAVDAGEFLVRISPARAGGVMTSRFTATASGTGLQEVYRHLPATTAGALPVQMSFGSAYPYGENIVRIPTYLPHVLPLGEHRGYGSDGSEVIGLGDVAITATRDQLHLVSLKRRQVIEPLVFHALALDKQPPPLARFLARLTRGFGSGWTAFDWGPHATNLPYLPRVRYGRVILSAARWRLTPDDLPGGAADVGWRRQLTAWRLQWRCPAVVELRDEDRTLRLDLDQPLHAAILHAHLHRYDEAVLAEAPDPTAYGWIDGHAHEIAIPLATTQRPTPSPNLDQMPVLNNQQAGQIPAAPDTRWLYARLHTHPDRHDEIIATWLPKLTAELAGASLWFLRYHSPGQTDHLRLRIRVSDPDHYGHCAARTSAWVNWLRTAGLAGWLVLDTYVPEVGRYGTGQALETAETVFAADSRLVVAELGPRPSQHARMALTAINMVGIVVGFLGLDAAMRWLIDRPVQVGAAADRTVAEAALSGALQVIRDGSPAEQPGWPTTVIEAWQHRVAALTRYRTVLPDGADVDTVMESLLHMHHNRARGIDPAGEAVCRRLARHAALSWKAQNNEASR